MLISQIFAIIFLHIKMKRETNNFSSDDWRSLLNDTTDPTLVTCHLDNNIRS